jgi:hypothetical protein
MAKAKSPKTNGAKSASSVSPQEPNTKAVEAAASPANAESTTKAESTKKADTTKAELKKAKAPKSPAPKLEAVRSEARNNVVPINLEDEIRRLAYLLSERRGFEPGHESEDWLAAELEVLQRYRQHSAQSA